jgi:hypothetical protein
MSVPYVAVGIGLTLAVVVVPGIRLIGAFVVIVATAIALAMRRGVGQESRLLGSILIGIGAVFLGGATSTTLACATSMCGEASTLPLHLLGGVKLGTGAIPMIRSIVARLSLHRH